MKKLIYIYFLFFSFGIIYAQQASDYFPDYPYAWWEYKITVLDSLSNEIDSLSYYRHDKVIDEAFFEGKLAKVLQTKSGPAETIYYQPYLDSIFLHFSSTDAHEYFKLGYIKILLNALDSVLNIPNFNFVEFFTSFEKWYSLYRFNQTVNDEYTILQFDTSITIDDITLPLRLEVLGERLDDDSISTPFGNFVSKKFVREIDVNLLVTLPPLPQFELQLFSLEDSIWIAEGHWIVQGVIPPINVDLSALNMNLPSFYIPGLITRLDSVKVTSIQEEISIPDEIKLSQNYPNPFNPTTIIKFTIAKSPLPGGDGRGGLVTLKVYDVLGNEIATLVNDEKSAGIYEVKWNATALPSGVYFYQLKTSSFVETRKMLMIK